MSPLSRTNKKPRINVLLYSDEVNAAETFYNRIVNQKLVGLAVITAAVVIGAVILNGGQMNWKSNLAQILEMMTGPQSVVARINAGKALLIDVRTDKEWNAGHAAHATHFDLARLQNGEMPPLPKDSAIYVYCRTGHRAGIAKTILEQSGYTNVTNLGGLSDWQTMGGAVE